MNSFYINSSLTAGRENVVKLLIENGADVNATQYDGAPAPLHMAVEYGNFLLVILYIEHLYGFHLEKSKISLCLPKFGFLAFL